MIEFIFSAGAITLFFCLCIVRQNLKRPRCYSYRKLRFKKASPYKATVFSNEKVDFVIIPNNCISFIFKDFNLCFDLGNIQSFVCNPASCLLNTGDFVIKITKNGFKINGNGKFIFSVSKPKCQYFYNTNKHELKLDDYIIKLENFHKLRLNGNKQLEFSAIIKGSAEINLNCFDFKVVANNKKIEILKRNFGFFNTSKWAQIPNFTNDREPANLLKRNYQKELLSICNKEVFIFNEKFREVDLTVENFEIKEQCLINLDKIGFSQIVNIKFKNNIITILDNLSGFNIKLICNKKVELMQICRLKTNYLLLKPEKPTSIRLSFMPNFAIPISLTSNLIIDKDLRFPKVTNLTSFLYNVNRLILHGVDVKVDKLFNLLNYKFLNKYARFMLGHAVVNYINTFKRFDLLKSREVKFLLEESLKFATENIGIKQYIYLKRVLPYVTNPQICDKILDIVLNMKPKIKGDEYELFLTEIVGLRLSGNLLFLEPKKDAVFDFSIWCRNHKLNLKKHSNGTNIKIDKLVYSGVEYIDLQNYPREIDIEFV